jgi:hypothetical protein
MFSHDDIQLVMYMRMNSEGSSTVVVSLLTTSIECRLMSILTRTVKYLDTQIKIKKENKSCTVRKLTAQQNKTE